MLESIQTEGGTCLGDAEKDAIKAQLERVLTNPHFAHSRRYPSFLRYVVDAALEGKADLLKERTIGIEVFGRDADYDTTADPIVRVTAAEIRKRIAQYYQETEDQSELLLSIPSGSYVPRFHRRRDEKPPLAAVPDPEPVTLLTQTPPPPEPRIPSLRSFGLATLMVILLAGGWWFWHQSHISALDRFWKPVLSSKEPVLFCVADQDQLSSISLRDAADISKQTALTDTLSVVVIDDVHTLIHIAGIMDAHGHPYRLKGEAATTLTDLREGPTVFIGAFDNAWTLRLTNSLRYRFRNNAEMTRFWIEDRQAPNRLDWVLDRKQQEATHNYRDYGIVARFTDGSTGKVAVIAAGIAKGATIAAGEFLAESNNLELLAARTPHFWDGKNIEVVISTEIIGGRSAPPKIEAVYIW